MFFIHNMQYSLLLLIYVQVQCDLVITRFTCVNVCSLNCLNLFLKYKIGQICLVCVCVFLGSICLKLLLSDNFENIKCCLDPWLSCMFDCIHICVFPFLKNCFYAISTASQHLLNTQLSIELFIFLLSQSRWLLDSQVDQLRFLLDPRQLLDSWWIDRASFSLLLICPLIDPQQLHLSTFCFFDTWLNKCLDTSQHLYLLRFTEPLYIGSM